MFSISMLNVIATGTALLIAGIISALAGAGAGVGAMFANKAEAQRQRDFEERMSNTAIQRQFADAQQAGVSPALFLSGGATTPMGATANINANATESAFANTANQLMDYIKSDRAMDFAEKMQNEKLEHITQMGMTKAQNTKDIANVFANSNQEVARIYTHANSANSKGFIKHNFTKKDLDQLYDDLDNVKLV